MQSGSAAGPLTCQGRMRVIFMMPSFLQCPRYDSVQRADDAALRERLLGMTTATATNMLNLRGYQHQFMSGARADTARRPRVWPRADRPLRAGASRYDLARRTNATRSHCGWPSSPSCRATSWCWIVAATCAPAPRATFLRHASSGAAGWASSSTARCATPRRSAIWCTCRAGPAGSTGAASPRP